MGEGHTASSARMRGADDNARDALSTGLADTRGTEEAVVDGPREDYPTAPSGAFEGDAEAAMLSRKHCWTGRLVQLSSCAIPCFISGIRNRGGGQAWGDGRGRLDGDRHVRATIHYYYQSMRNVLCRTECGTVLPYAARAGKYMKLHRAGPRGALLGADGNWASRYSTITNTAKFMPCPKVGTISRVKRCIGITSTSDQVKRL